MCTEIPFLEPCDTTSSISHPTSAVNYPLQAVSQQPPPTLWEDQARPYSMGVKASL